MSSAARGAPSSTAQAGRGSLATLSARAARLELTVEEGDTAPAFRSGDVPVVSTARLVALCEEACLRFLTPRLSPEETTVASRVHFDHLAPVKVGTTVAAEATLERTEGRRFVFTVSVTGLREDCSFLVGAGRVTRVLVNRDAFLAKAALS